MSAICSDVINLAIGLNIPGKKPSIMQAIRDNCCNTILTKVTCNSTEVVYIDWSSMQLNGKINGTALPITLKRLYLDRNPIKASDFEFPPSLEKLDLSLTAMVMPLPLLPNTIDTLTMYYSDFINVTSFPEGMTEFNCGSSKLSGVLPTIPSTMVRIHADANSFSGPLPVLPNSLIYAKFNNNKFNGSVPSLSSALVYGQFQNNLFTGQLPPIPVNVQEINFAFNSFTGSVFIDSTVLSILSLQGNYFTGNLTLPSSINQLVLGDVIKSTNKFTGHLNLTTPILINIFNNSFTQLFVQDTSLLTTCELAFNPLTVINDNLSICNVSSLQHTTNNTAFATLYSKNMNVDSTFYSDYSTSTLMYNIRTRKPLTSSTSLIQFTTYDTDIDSNSHTSINMYYSTTEIQSTTITYLQINPTLILLATPSYSLFGKLIIDWMVLTLLLNQLYQRYKRRRGTKSNSIQLMSNA